MSDFKILENAMHKHFKELSKNKLFIADVDRDLLWQTYLNSYPADEKQDHTCNCCRSFVKNYGALVAYQGKNRVSIWDFEVPAPFNNVVNTLKDLVSKAAVKEVFVSKKSEIGRAVTKDSKDGKIIEWRHLNCILPSTEIFRGDVSIESMMGTYRSNHDVFKRSLETITKESLETTLELIDQNSLYRGAEFKSILESFLKLKKDYIKLNEEEKENYAWSNSVNVPTYIAKIRNSAIGTLLQNLSENKDLDFCVTAFEKVMAPTNYKRPTAIVTKKMIEEAEKTIEELGLTSSLGRCFSKPEDIKVTNLLFVNRDKKKITGSVFDDLKENVAVNPKTLSKVEEISAADFIEKILPKITEIEVLVENKFSGNFVSLISPQDKDSKALFKWGNPFSWSYANALADSMKERVKAAGGKVDGIIRYSIQWNEDGKSIVDLDAHAYEPNREHINFMSFNQARGSKGTSMSGILDVDMVNPSGTGVENITWSNESKMKEGVYIFKIHNYSGHRNFKGFSAEIEFNGEIYEFSTDQPFTGYMDVAHVTYSKTTGFSIKPLMPSNSHISSKKVWNVDTNKFHKVSMIMKSPNHWDDKKIGNEHLFFILDEAKNTETVRGFFNEFLTEDFSKDRKVFEILAGKMKVEESDKQVSGLGFSSTQKNEVICKVGSKNFNRTLKIKF